MDPKFDSVLHNIAAARTLLGDAGEELARLADDPVIPPLDDGPYTYTVLTPADVGSDGRIFLNPSPMEVFLLVGDFRGFILGTKATNRLRILASKAQVAGIRINGGNVDWKGGLVSSLDGETGRGREGYGIHLERCSDVRVTGVNFENNNRGIVTDRASRIGIFHNTFSLGQDGIIANLGEDVDICFNTFRAVTNVLTTCTLPNGEKKMGLSRRGCEVLEGSWQDGWHQDGIQVRNGIKRLNIIGNDIQGVSQGIGEMNASTDAPLEAVLCMANRVEVTGYHSITFAQNSTGLISHNHIAQLTGRKTVFRFPSTMTLGEGNTGSSFAHQNSPL